MFLSSIVLLWISFLATKVEVCKGIELRPFSTCEIPKSHVSFQPLDGEIRDVTDCAVRFLGNVASGGGNHVFTTEGDECILGKLSSIAWSRTKDSPNVTVYRNTGCVIPPPVGNGTWDCYMNIAVEKCFLVCNPGYIPKTIIGTYCVDEKSWDRDLRLFSCVPTVALLIGSMTSSRNSVELFGRNLSQSLPNVAGSWARGTINYFSSKLFVTGGWWTFLRRYEYIPSAVKIQDIMNLANYIRQHAGVVVQDRLYFLGGYDNKAVTNYFTERDSTIQRTPLSPVHTNGCGVRLTGSSYLYTGNGASVTATIEYNVETSTYITHGNMKIQRDTFSCTTFIDTDGELTVLAGGGTGTAAATSEIFKKSTGEWIQVGNLKYSRIGARLVTLPDGIFILGGSNNVLQVEEFIVSNHSWVVIPQTLKNSHEDYFANAVPAMLFN